jgi:hypothetical protein
VTDQDIDDDGRRDFDFLFGSWHVANRKLADVWDPGCMEWTEFTSAAVVRPLLANLATMDCYSTTEFPGSGPMEGITLRLFNPQTRLWRIWWASTRQPGDLDTPVEGRFAGGLGEFFCDDTLNGRSLRVRYAWTRTDPEHPRWTQAFSYDGGTTWKTNWIMELTRDFAPDANGGVRVP